MKISNKIANEMLILTL